MARPAKKGLDYFPIDVAFYRDFKIKKLRRICNSVGVDVYFYLLTLIYENGYFIPWDDQSAFEVSYDLHLTEEDVNKVVNEAISIGLFDRHQFAHNRILTSHGIQKRWERISKDSNKAINSVPEKHLVKSDETPVKSDETPVKSDETPVKSEESTQRKGKEIKGKEIEEKSTKKEQPPDLSPSKDEWMNYCSVHGYNPSYAEHLFEHMEAVGWKDQQGRSIHKWTAYANKNFKYQENFLKSLKPNASNKNGYKSGARQTTGERIEQIYNERAETA
jgi:hypothetical protein